MRSCGQWIIQLPQFPVQWLCELQISVSCWICWIFSPLLFANNRLAYAPNAAPSIPGFTVHQVYRSKAASIVSEIRAIFGRLLRRDWWDNRLAMVDHKIDLVSKEALGIFTYAHRVQKSYLQWSYLCRRSWTFLESCLFWDMSATLYLIPTSSQEHSVGALQSGAEAPLGLSSAEHCPVST